MRRESYLKLAKKLKSTCIEQVAIAGSKPQGSPASTAAGGQLEASLEERAKAEKNDEDKKLSKPLRKLTKMPEEELVKLLSSDDNFNLDCLLDSVESIRELQRQRDDLERQVSDLAKFNYAREPEFVKDRLQLREMLDEVSSIKRRLTGRYLVPILDKLQASQEQLCKSTMELEEQCERLAQEFLNGTKGYEEFKEAYTKLRTEASQKRILSDKLSQERNWLAENLSVSPSSPHRMLRQRKKVSFTK